jgi:bifunctional oligoribonuclease and PAP phosphatase NrnA
MSDAAPLARIRDLVARGRRFLITSHARPDGDAIGSQLALAGALRALGKTVRIVNRDPVPEPFLPLPGAGGIEVAGAVEGEFDAAFVLECGDLSRPGVAGLDRYTLVNIDHHIGNTGYGAITWFDSSASACGELVLELIDALGVPLSREIATGVYVAILTDTGSFHHANITARTFDMCRRAAEAGVDPAAIARQVFDSGNAGKLKLMGALLAGMELEAGGRLAVMHLDEAMLSETGSTKDDTEGLINLPLTAREVQAVVMFKVERPGETRVSLRSKGVVDVRAVAALHGGGGHTNAAGFTAPGAYAEVRARIVRETADAIAKAR